MSKPSRATQAKRQRERDRQERAQEKEEKRVTRTEAKKDRVSSLDDGIDPDLIGIFPGPQPPPED